MDQIVVDFAQQIVMNNKLLALMFFFVSQSLQILFPPYPGDMVLVLEGYLSGLANLNILVVIMNAIIASSLSAIFLYNIGVAKGYKILESKLINSFFDTNKIRRFNNNFEKYGYYFIFLSNLCQDFIL